MCIRFLAMLSTCCANVAPLFFLYAMTGHSMQADRKLCPSSSESFLGKCPTIRLACRRGKITIHSGTTIRVTLAAPRNQIDLDVLARMNWLLRYSWQDELRCSCQDEFRWCKSVKVLSLSKR